LVNLANSIRDIKSIKNHNKFEQNIYHIEHIRNLMKKLYFDEKTGFKKIYTSYHNYKKDYYLIANLVEGITKDIVNSLKVKREIKEIFKKFYTEKVTNESSETIDNSKNLYRKINQKNELPLTLNDIWERRLKNDMLFKVPNNIEYRKKIHYETINKLLNNGYLSSIDNIKPYQLTFIKVKLPEKEDEKFDSFNFSSIYENDKYYSTLGIYDFVKIKYQKNSHIEMKSDILKELEEKKDKHYKAFISLMSIMDAVKGKNSKKEFNTIIQIEIDKNLSTQNIRDTYNDLFGDLFKKNKRYIYK